MDGTPGTAGPLPGPPTPPVREHTAALAGSDAELLAAAVPFVEQGLSAGDLVLLSCRPETAELVRRAVGRRADVLDVDQRVRMAGVRSPDAVAATLQHLRRAAARGSGALRIVGEVDFGSTPHSRREGERYESAVNALLDGAAVASLCLYDRRVLPEEVLASRRCTHPTLLEGGHRTASADYRDPGEYLRLLARRYDPDDVGEPVLAVDGVPALAPLRRRLAGALAGCVPDRHRAEDLHLALSEIAANAFRHGTRPVSVRLWAGGGRVVCTITDRGRSFDDPLAGFRPAHGDDLGRGGMGLWLARKLWDSVDLVAGPDGLTVRLVSEAA